jgi:hypothetical protein
MRRFFIVVSNLALNAGDVDLATLGLLYEIADESYRDVGPKLDLW